MAAEAPFIPSWQKSPSLAERSSERYATPKHAMKSRLDVKADKDLDDAKQLEQWRKDVRTRDKGRCRVCKVKTEQTLELVPKRGEGHHIASRKEKAVRYDVRNGLHTCLKCHQRFTAGKLFVIATARQMFTVERKSYINGDCMDLRFEANKLSQ